MKQLFAVGIAILLFSACKKNNDKILIDEATVTILHSTCVKTIVKIEAPINTNIGVSWSNNLIANPVLHQRVIKIGTIKNVPVTGLAQSKQYQVRIYDKATVPQFICDLSDPVNEPGIVYDIEFIK